MPRPLPPGRLVSHRHHQHALLPGIYFLALISVKGKAMAAVHYYLGRPARVWISAHSRRSPAREARNGSGRVHSDIPGQPATGFTPSVPAAAHGAADAHSRRGGNRKPPVTAASGRPPDAAPTGGLLARRRIAIARFGADVAAAGGIGPALAAGLDPGDYPVVPGGVPQAWERAQLYLGLCERYQDLYQVQVAELHILMATVPECSLPLSHRRPLTGPLTDTHTGYISLNTARLRRRPQQLCYRPYRRLRSCSRTAPITHCDPPRLALRPGGSLRCCARACPVAAGL